MPSLEAFESQMRTAVRTLAGAAVTELARLLEERSANAANKEEEKEERKVTLCRSFNAHIQKQFESFLDEWTRDTVEKISVMFKVFVSEAAEEEDAPPADHAHQEASAVVAQEEMIKSTSGTHKRSKVRRRGRKERDHVFCRDEQETKKSAPDSEAVSAAGVSHEDSHSEPEASCDVSEGEVLQDDPSPAATSDTDKKKIKCPSCEKTFSQKCLMERHYLSHSKPHHCSQCGKRFSVVRGLDAHMRKHTGRMLHKCPDCGTEFAYKSTFQRHMRHQHCLKTASASTCSLCEEKFPGTLALQRHRCSALKKTMVCSLCPETFQCRRSLSEHESLHPGRRDFVCEVCGEMFLSFSSLATHRVAHVQTGDRCGDAGVPVKHLNERTGGRSFTCQVCGKGCSHRSALKHHMLTHTGERPYVCDTCGKRCGHASALQNHLRVHTGRKPGQLPLCHVCGKQFRRVDRLKSHMSVHTGEKPHACSQCGKKFSAPEYLKAHVLVHSKMKPYGCGVCSKRFAHMYSFKMHQRIHTGERAQRCNVCGKDFVYSRFLQLHLRTHRPDEVANTPSERT